MSSILKALKKLEEEKKPSTGRVDHVSRYGEPVAPGARRPRNTVLLLVCGMLAGLLAAGGWIFWNDRDGAGEKSVQTVVAPVPDQATEQPPAAVEKLAVSTATQPPAEAQQPSEKVGDSSGHPSGTTALENTQPVADVDSDRLEAESPAADREESAETTKTVVEIPVPAVRPVPAAVKPAAADVPAGRTREATAGGEAQATKAPDDRVETGREVRSGKTEAVAAIRQEPVKPTSPVDGEVAAGSAAVPFQVMEIFYQPDAGSMAVVDDLPVMEGTIVNGVLVEKIFPDRVRFIVDGQPVEVHTGGNQP